MATAESSTLKPINDGVAEPEENERNGASPAAVAAVSSKFTVGQSVATAAEAESTRETMERVVIASAASNSEMGSSALTPTCNEELTYSHPEISTAIGASEPILPSAMSMRVTAPGKTRALARRSTFHPEISSSSFADDDAFLRTVSMRVTPSERTHAVGAPTRLRPESSSPSGVRADEAIPRKDLLPEPPTQKLKLVVTPPREGEASNAVPVIGTSPTSDKAISEVVSMMTRPEISTVPSLESKITSPPLETHPPAVHVPSKVDSTSTEGSAKILPAFQPDPTEQLAKERTPVHPAPVLLNSSQNVTSSTQVGMKPPSQVGDQSIKILPESPSLPKRVAEAVKPQMPSMRAADGARKPISDEPKLSHVCSFPDHSINFSAQGFHEKTPSKSPAGLTSALDVAIVSDSKPGRAFPHSSTPKDTLTRQPEKVKLGPRSPAAITPAPETVRLTPLTMQESSPNAGLSAKDLGFAEASSVKDSPQTSPQSESREPPLNAGPAIDIDSEKISPKFSREISREDRKAIVNALTRKTVSQDAVFQESPSTERNYISDTAARKTITDHSKDLAPITEAEREALLELATRRTLIQSDKEVISSLQKGDTPIWYTNLISSPEFDSKDATFGGRTEDNVLKPPSTLVDELEATRRHVTEKVETKHEKHVDAGVGGESADHHDEKTLSTESQHAEEPLVRKLSRTHSKAVSSSPSSPEASIPDPVPSFPGDPPVMPFSKKERRELVRSISMQIKDPEVPLWDMDLMDIEEAEQAELEKNIQRHSPHSLDPGFDFDEPIKPRVPVRRSKRHRTVRVHATDYARAQAVELHEFCTNEIQTSKYTWMTFLPMNLFYQCTRSANLYFILIAALQLVPGFSPTPWGTTVAPLVFVMLLNAVKEGIDEFKRSLSDRIVNKQKVEVLNENHFVTTKWRSVIVGDIVQVKCDQEFPADLVFLSSSDVKGLAYIETANLDGETDLKIRNAFYKGSRVEDDETPLSIFSGLTIECELPNNRLYKFEGAINLQDYGKLPLDTRQILLRGATLRNTDWILGAVVYTGADTKFVRNMIPGQLKITGLERNMNILVAIVFVCQVALCVGLAAANDTWTRDEDNASPYIPDFQEFVHHIGPAPHEIGAQFGRFLILLNQLIPISLYVTLELVKVVQSFYIDRDALMYHTSSKTHAKARTTNLNEELGQVQYIMSDKTGTLTQNIMAFVQCSIGSVVYGTIQHEGGFLKRRGNSIHTLCNDPKLIQKLKEVVKGSQDIDSDYLRAFFCHLALCHVVHPVYAKKGDESVAEDVILKYAGASPDEEALAQGAADCGYQLRKRTQDELLLYDPESGLQKFIIMAVLEFTSERKRMSIICRDSKGRIKLYCKGADSVIFKRLARGQEELVDTSLNQLEDFARCGYRTMCMAEREISGSEYEKWAARFRAASIALDDRDEKLAAVSETIERDMFLLGVTAVEDKLQAKVPETITLLAQAGIKVWVLTGDKLETSVSVALSCNLLADSMHLFLLSENVSKSVPQLLRSMLDEARKQQRAKLRLEESDFHSELALVIEGSSLTVALEETNKMLLLDLLKLCRSVLCCRVTPLQKAQVTMLLKDHGNSVILAIGDGANDCGMISAAHIGVGIGGREGMAAVLASDYSMARFRYLRRLLLVHGRWSYLRNRELVMYAFYKNIVYALGNFYLAFYSGYSSQALYSAAEIATYNLVWTSLPTIMFAIFNKDMSDCTAENNPQIYSEFQNERRPEFFWCLLGWMLCAIWDSIVAFFFPYLGASVASNHGESASLAESGSVIYTMAIFIATLRMLYRTHSFDWFHFAAFQISTSLWLLVFFCTSFSFKLSGFFPDLAGVGAAATQRPTFWLLLLLCPIAAILPYFAFRAFHSRRAPDDSELMREMEHGWKDGEFDPDAKDYVEQITAPIPELRRTSMELPDDEYGPSPLQKKIADKREAVLGTRRASAKAEDVLRGKAGALAESAGGEGSQVQTPSSGSAKGEQARLKPRRLTWRQVVNDDELEDLATSESLGRDGRRKSNGFRVVTRHDDAPQAPISIVHGPTPATRKSVTFADKESRPSSASSDVPKPQKSPPEGSPQHPKPSLPKKYHVEPHPADTRLKAVRANLAKHAEERRNLVGGTGAGTGTGTSSTSAPSPARDLKRQLKKKQKLWDAVKQAAAEPDIFRDQRHPLQKMNPIQGSTPTEHTGASKQPTKGSSSRPAGRGSPGTPSGQSPKSIRPGGAAHAPGAAGSGEPSSSGASSKDHPPHLPYSAPHHASGSGGSGSHHGLPAKGEASTSSMGSRPESPAKDQYDSTLKSKSTSKGRKPGQGRSRLNS